MIRRKKRNYDDPICHPDHRRPRTRREFLSQGFILGGASVLGGATISLGPGKANATLSPELLPLIQGCGIATQGAGKIPFIAFDLAGGS
ncbi:MAG: general secretion pathway protein GspF, partial [Gammaproteobacteria bacterium]|nr:general secretion pathway protein GspF [Gammaproteobacteria bacterium]